MALTQAACHFGEASGTEANYRVLAAQNFGVSLPPGRAILARIGVQATGGVAHANTAWQWQYEHTPKATGTPSAWTNVTTTSAVVRTGATAVFADGANCTQRITGLTGTFEASGAGCTHDGSAGGAANDIAANGNSETLIGLQVINADTAVGDTIRLRLLANGSPLGTYSQFPTILVAANILSVSARDTSEQVSTSAAVSRISGTSVGLAVVGLSAADLADSTLSFVFTVWGTTVQGSTDPADYTVPLDGPSGFACGNTGTKPGKYLGLPIPPEYSFTANFTQDIERVLARVTANKSVTWGVDATITGDV